MKILLINKFLYPKGGDAICTLDTGKLLSRKGHQASYWGMSHPDNPDYPYKNLFVNHIDLVNCKGPWQQIKAAANVLYSFEAQSKLKRVLSQIQPDIVHLNNFAHQISPSILHVIKKSKIPAVMTLHDYKLVCPSYGLFMNGKTCEKCKSGKYYHCLTNRCTKGSRAKSLVNVLEMYLHHRILHIYNNIDVFISPSQFLKAKVNEMGFDRDIAYLPNFVDLEQYSPQYDWKERSVVFFGRLSHEKGLGTLIDAVKELDVTLKIIGDGPIRHELEQKAAAERIDNVMFLGYKSSEELRKIVSNAMVILTPSECYENNPLSVLESFASGKPVIGAKIGGIPELVKDGKTGYTFEPGNTDDLRSKIKLLTGNPEKIIQMGRNARKFVEDKFNPEQHYNQLIDIYEKTIHNKKH